MSTQTVITVLCDMPHDGDEPEAQTVSVTTPDGTWEVDVCPDHAAKFLLPVIAAGRRIPKTRAKRGSLSAVAL